MVHTTNRFLLQFHHWWVQSIPARLLSDLFLITQHGYCTSTSIRDQHKCQFFINIRGNTFKQLLALGNVMNLSGACSKLNFYNNQFLSYAVSTSSAQCIWQSGGGPLLNINFTRNLFEVLLWSFYFQYHDCHKEQGYCDGQ